jgi:hypothetical protein
VYNAHWQAVVNLPGKEFQFFFLIEGIDMEHLVEDLFRTPGIDVHAVRLEENETYLHQNVEAFRFLGCKDSITEILKPVVRMESSRSKTDSQVLEEFLSFLEIGYRTIALYKMKSKSCHGMLNLVIDFRSEDSFCLVDVVGCP